MKIKLISLSAVLLLLAQGAYSAPIMSPSSIIPGLPMGAPMDRYAESGDAGDMPGTAATLPAGTTSITGLLTSGNDVDMYSFIWGGGLFEAEVLAADFDTQLFLFDAAGVLLFEDDDGAVFPLSLISENLAAGSYYLAITQFDNDPLNAAGNDIENCVRAGSDVSCGGDLALASWRGTSGAGGDYEIAISATGGSMPMPEPGILVLFGLGLAGLGFARRRA